MKRAVIALVAVLVAGCSQTVAESNANASAQGPQIQPTAPAIRGTQWTLVRFQSSDDAIGSVVPPNVARYTFDFQPDGTLVMQLDCNRARGRWQETSQSAGGGTLTLMGGPMTRAACPPGAIDTQIARDLARLRSYMIRDNHLFLALEADGGIYEFVRN